jgi:AcrR family transcriptional regulator
VTNNEIIHSKRSMQTPTESPLMEADTRRVETSERILDEAERLFRHYGFAKTTIADIARELGMSPANIYRFFASKSAIHEAIATRMLATQEIALQEVSKRSIPAADKLRIFVIDRYNTTVAQMLDETKVHEMVTVALDQHWPIIDRHLHRITEILARVIAEGIRSGEFAERDPMVAARCFKAAVISVCHPSVVSQCRFDADRATPEEIAEFAIRALRA